MLKASFIGPVVKPITVNTTITTNGPMIPNKPNPLPFKLFILASLTVLAPNTILQINAASDTNVRIKSNAEVPLSKPVLIDEAVTSVFIVVIKLYIWNPKYIKKHINAILAYLLVPLFVFVAGVSS